MTLHWPTKWDDDGEVLLEIACGADLSSAVACVPAIVTCAACRDTVAWRQVTDLLRFPRTELLDLIADLEMDLKDLRSYAGAQSAEDDIITAALWKVERIGEIVEKRFP